MYIRSTVVGATWLLMIGLLWLQGCSSGKTVGGVLSPPEAPAVPTDDASHDLALQHFIDGSVCEMKGDYARAVLEFQDALRYEKNHAIFFALAKNYSLLGKHALAIDAGKEAVRLDPDNVDYRRSLAEISVAAFDMDLAIAQYEEIVKRDSSSLDARYNLARLYQTNMPMKALEVYDQIIARFGPEWEVLLQIADLCNRLGRYEKATDALRQMSEIDPANLELQRSLAQAYARAGKYDEALVVLKGLLELRPDNLDYLGEIASVHLLRREYAKATEEFETILSRDSVSLETKLDIGKLYFGQIEKDSSVAPVARAVFERIRDRYPQDWRAYWFLGAIGSMMRDDSLTVPNFRRVTELAGWNADAWVYLSSVFLERNNFEDVVKVLESALRIVPDDFRVNFMLGIAYNRLGRNVEAARVLERSRELNPKDIDAIIQLALVYDNLKKLEESDSLYEEALRLDPKNDLALNNYGYSLADRGIQLDRAFAMAKRALEAQPENPSYLDTMGWVYFRLGKYGEAETYVRKAINKGEVNAVVYEHLGDIYYKLDDTQRALEHWHSALKLDEGNTALREKISRGSL